MVLFLAVAEFSLEMIGAFIYLSIVNKFSQKVLFKFARFLV